ncbi:GerAB/ArcD/ProY family transporter [Bacillus pinisoli]|uniref:GerAB/ArcD/ProY family transporter n=1 Tax=Bacillus pinisoli TaxID=2901866 RepID=UPI001FF4BCA6
MIINMLINIFLYVPNILLEERFNGSVLGIVLGCIIGTLFLYVFTLSMNKFPRLGLPEILNNIPKWFRLFFLCFFSIIWFLAGCVTLLAFNNVTIRFVNPDISGINMISVFTIAVILMIARLKSDKVLYTIEILFVVNSPLILIIILQAYFHEYINWNSIVEVGTHFKAMPSLSVLAAASFTFSGYANMVIFNRVFKEKVRLKWLWVIPIIGFINLCTTFFIPIGFWGADGAGDLTFPWVTTADTLFIEFGPIERLITLFILLYVSVSIISVVVHWHVAFEVIKSMIGTDNKKVKNRSIIHFMILAVFGGIVIFLEYQLREQSILEFGEYWLNVRLPSEALLVLLLLFLARRKKANG